MFDLCQKIKVGETKAGVLKIMEE